jgi:hypothetical protein
MYHYVPHDRCGFYILCPEQKLARSVLPHPILAKEGVYVICPEQKPTLLALL